MCPRVKIDSLSALTGYRMERGLLLRKGSGVVETDKPSETTLLGSICVMQNIFCVRKREKNADFSPVPYSHQKGLPWI